MGDEGGEHAAVAAGAGGFHDELAGFDVEDAERVAEVVVERPGRRQRADEEAPAAVADVTTQAASPPCSVTVSGTFTISNVNVPECPQFCLSAASPQYQKNAAKRLMTPPVYDAY